MKPILTVSLIAMCAGALLVVVHIVTREPIEANRSTEEVNRMAGLVDTTDVEKLCEQGIELQTIEIQGYGGLMKVLVAFQNEKVLGVRVTRHDETPGFDSILAPDDWIQTFGSKPVDEIDAVSRATITSRAVLRAVEEAMDQHREQEESC